MKCGHTKSIMAGKHGEYRCMTCNIMYNRKGEEIPEGGGFPIAPGEGDNEARRSIVDEQIRNDEDQWDLDEDGPWTGHHH